MDERQRKEEGEGLAGIHYRAIVGMDESDIECEVLLLLIELR